MSCLLENIEGDAPRLGIMPLWVLFVLGLLPMLQEYPEGRVGWSGFMGWYDESSFDEVLSDFVVEGECY